MPACPAWFKKSSVPLCPSPLLFSLLSLLPCPLPLAAKNKVGRNGRGGGGELWGAPVHEDRGILVQSLPWCCPLEASAHIQREHSFGPF